MAKLTNVQRIVTEDFAKNDQPTVAKLAYIINNVFDQLTHLFDKGIVISDNVNEDIVTATLTVDTNGVPTVNTQLKYSLVGSCQGISVINVSNLTNAATNPTSAPFVLFTTPSSSLINITKVYGLPAANQFKLTLRVTGS